MCVGAQAQGGWCPREYVPAYIKRRLPGIALGSGRPVRQSNAGRVNSATLEGQERLAWASAVLGCVRALGTSNRVTTELTKGALSSKPPATVNHGGNIYGNRSLVGEKFDGLLYCYDDENPKMASPLITNIRLH